MLRIQPGYAFTIVCDLGFAVGVASHLVDRMGTLVWMAERIVESEPTIDDVLELRQWRWPVFFPLGAAVRRKIVYPVGVIPVPRELRAFPALRGGTRQMGWKTVTYDESGRETVGPKAAKPSMPISQIVNDTALKEMLVSNWRPEHDW